jgi:hypothetical protein
MAPGWIPGEAVSADRQRGFTYFALLLALSLFTSGSLVFAALWSEGARRERELEWLRIGDTYAKAIAAHYESSPGTSKNYPATLENLLQDLRFAGVRRHLRRLYPDPLAPEQAWAVVRGQDGGIVGVYSTASGRPRIQSNLPSTAVVVSPMRSYSDVRFLHQPAARR